ncbi:MAG: adenosylcobinamide-GDP ribazoletransferase [Halanaeroarchaeum sp.]
MVTADAIRARAVGHLRALVGAVGFLTTIPLPHTAAAWEAFRRRPWILPAVGYPIGALVSLPVLVSPPGRVRGLGLVFAVLAVTGIVHLDGLTDVADALAVHGTTGDRVAAMEDAAVGVGGLLAGTVALLGLFVLGAALPEWSGAIRIAIGAEVAAKLAVLVVLARGSARHEGLGSALAESVGRRSMVPGVVLAAPVVASSPSLPGGLAVLAGGVAVGLGLEALSRDRFGGINGDVLGAANELARLVGLGVGVIAWTLS